MKNLFYLTILLLFIGCGSDVENDNRQQQDFNLNSLPDGKVVAVEFCNDEYRSYLVIKDTLSIHRRFVPDHVIRYYKNILNKNINDPLLNIRKIKKSHVTINYTN